MAPLTVSFGAQAPLVEEHRDFSGAIAFLYIPMKNLADHVGFFLIDGEVEVIADGLVIAIDNVGDPAFFGVHLFAELDPFGSIGAFLLCQRAKDGQHKLAVAHTGHVGSQKLGLDAKGFQLADILQQINRVAGKAGDVLDHHHLKETVLSVRHHPQKFFAVFGLCAGDALIGVQADQIVAGALGILHKESFLRCQAVQLIFFVGGDPAVSGNVHTDSFSQNVL